MAQFITALAGARAQEVPLVLQGRAEAAWVRRWSAILACTAARAFSLSLLDSRPLVDSRPVGGSGDVSFRPRGPEGGPFFLSTGVFCFS